MRTAARRISCHPLDLTCADYGGVTHQRGNGSWDNIKDSQAEGIVSGANHVGKREVLAPPPR